MDSLITPLPHGPNADEEVDVDYAEKAARALLMFIEACDRFFQPQVSKFVFYLGWRKVEFF